MGGGISIPGLQTRKPTDEERDCRCGGCGVILVCEVVANMGQNTYAFMKRALETRIDTASTKSGVGEVLDGTFLEVGSSVSIVKGDFLITYLCKKEEKPMCTDCFREAYPEDFAGVLLTSVGKAKVINSKYQWRQMSYGNQ